MKTLKSLSAQYHATAVFYRKCGDKESCAFYEHVEKCINKCIYDINLYKNKGGVIK